MFLNHQTAFDTFAPVTTDAAPQHTLNATASTILETPHGWRPISDLQAGDSVATLDGGFTEITGIAGAASAQLVRVPGGTLSTCSDIALPADCHVALPLPATVSEAPVVSVPLKALVGWRGIRPAMFPASDLATLTFAEEEMVYAQTGLLLHAADQAPGFYDRKTYGETRALLALMDRRMPGPDLAFAA